MSNITHAPKVSRATPYVAPGAPTSPLWGRAVGLVLAAIAWIAGRFGLELEFSAEDVMVVAGLAFSAWSTWQDRRARAEMVPGVDLLEAALDEPPSAERLPLADSVERLRKKKAEASARLTVLDPPEPVDEPIEPAMVDPRASTQGEEWEKWAREAFAAICSGQAEGKVGPISWHQGESVTRLTVYGYNHAIAPGDTFRAALVLGLPDAYVRLQAIDEQVRDPATPTELREELRGELLDAMEANGQADVHFAEVQPRVHLPSGALLNDDGEPVSASDLDSEERVTDRVLRADVEAQP